MSLRYLVGYRPDERGEDALRLAVTLARSFGADLDLVFVVREHSAYAPAYPPVGREEPLIARTAQGWLDTAAAGVRDAAGAAGDGDALRVSTHVRYAPSVAEGLMKTADEFDSALVILGAGSAGAMRRHTLGATASMLLHRANRPVTLVPRGYRAAGRIERIDCAVGLRPGGRHLVDEAVEVAARQGLPLRLLTMVDVDASDTEEFEAAAQRARHHVEQLLAEAQQRHGAAPSTDIVLARGGISAALASIDWHEANEQGSVLLVGASRLAEPRRFFLGGTVHRMLRELTVPVIAVPAGPPAGHEPGSGSPTIQPQPGAQR